MRLAALILLASVLAAADPAAAILDELRAANQARADLAREEAAWSAEQQRLQALIAATTAETDRLAVVVGQAERECNAARDALVALGGAGDLDDLRVRLASAGAAAMARLRALAATVLPGIIRLGEDEGFDAAIAALERAELAAGAVTVEVVSGQRNGRTEAVKLLRVAGAAAWWVSLDGAAAGTAAMRDGTLLLLQTSDQSDAIRAALAQAEGRATPTIVVLP